MFGAVVILSVWVLFVLLRWLLLLMAMELFIGVFRYLVWCSALVSGCWLSSLFCMLVCVGLRCLLVVRLFCYLFISLLFVWYWFIVGLY